MFLGVIPIFWFEFLSEFWRKSQKGAKKENCANRTFAVAKGTFAAAKCFAAEKAASPRRGRGPKMATHWFTAAKRFTVAKTLFTVGKKILFCF